MSEIVFDVNANGEEVLGRRISNHKPVDLIAALLALALCYGMDRVEKAIHATYFRREADQIISGMNIAMKLATTGANRPEANGGTR